MKKKVFLDAYLFDNLGDDLFVDILASRYPDTEFVTISAFYKPVTDNVKVVSPRGIEKIFGMNAIRRFLMKKCGLIVSIGGSMYIENTSRPNCIYEAGQDLYVLGANFGPYQSQAYLDKFKTAFSKAKDVCFRDRDSAALFADLENVRMAPDILFSCPLIEKPKEAASDQIFISVMKRERNSREYMQFLRDTACFWNEKGLSVVLGSFCALQGDLEACRQLQESLPFESRIVSYEGDRRAILEELEKSSHIVASRFHAGVLGLAMEKQVLPVSYSNKTDHLFGDLGLEDCLVNIDGPFPKPEDARWASLSEEKAALLRQQAQEHFAALDGVLS